MDWLRPSAAHRWLKCTGSILLEHNERLHPTLPPLQASEAAQRGTRLHEIAAKLIKGEPVDLNSLETEDKAVVTGYYEYIKGMRSGVGEGNYREFIEFNVPILFFNGTIDYAMVFNTTLVIVDLKTGQVPVSPQGNPQLYLYAHGLLQSLFDINIKNVALVIYQNDAKEAQVPPLDIMEFIEYEVNYVLRDVDAGNVTFRSGDYCKWCSYQALCPMKRNQILGMATGQFTEFTPIADDVLTNDVRIADEMLSYYKSLESAANLARDLIIHRYDKLNKTDREGLSHVLHENKPKRVWTGDAMERLCKAYPDVIDTIAPRQLASPAAVESALQTVGYEFPSDVITEIPGNKILRRKP